ncbi:uncharacterized protein EAE97_005500 [Botrytis byssoidea]|uniref:Uncharacterized protein n=1 Tax=Botrytis byssoidea TaxID=139641 RepID=A0A9P5M729_9HELO|nr:uncharacterized protein EAE97_005500 [Botrytis byssoidea]KAF7944867.1 hypothetical protein EAE97_005500 [Botrytis byssoidea]
MAARHTPVPSVGSSGSTFSSTVSREKNLSDVYVDFHKEYQQLLIRNKQLSDNNRNSESNKTYVPIAVEKCHIALISNSNHDRVPGATPVPSSSARDKLQEVVASLLPAIGEPFFQQFSVLRNEIEGKIRLWDALVAENIKLSSAARIKQAMEDAKSASDKSFAEKKIANDKHDDELDLENPSDKRTLNIWIELEDFKIPETRSSDKDSI